MKKFSKSIILILTLVLAMSLSFAVSAEDGEVANDSDWKYELLEDGSAKITAYIGESAEVVIPESIGDAVVTTLGSDVFRKSKGVETVTVPDSVVTMESTFYMAETVKEVNIGKGLKTLSDRAFYCAWALEKISVHEENENFTSVNGILYSKDMKRLVTVPSGMKADKLVIPQGVEVLGKNALRDADIAVLELPDTLKTIESYAISVKGLKELVIPGSVEFIDMWAIYSCPDLSCISFEEGNLFEIGDMIIENCEKLELLNIESSKINKVGMMMGCSNMKIYGVVEENQYFTSLDGVLFNIEMTELISYPCGKPENAYTIPDTVEVIGEKSFYGAKNLTDIYMPDSVKVIEPFAFAYCSGLTTVYYDGTKEQFEAIDIDEETVFFSNVVFPEPHVHSYDTVKVIKKATNKANGKVEYICSCGESYKETVYELDSVKLSTSKCTYNGKKRTPSVIAKDSKGNTLKKDVDYTVKYESGRKMPGRYKITVTFKGKYEYKKEFDFVIMPKTPTLKVTTSKGKATLSYTDLAGVTGYQIYYSTDGKTYKKLVTTSKEKYSKTLKSGKKYYFKVRGYVKPASGNTVYGSFSSAKSVKIA